MSFFTEGKAWSYTPGLTFNTGGGDRRRRRRRQQLHTHTLARHTFLQGAPATQSSSRTQPNPTPRQTFTPSLGNHYNTNTSNTKGLSTLHLTYVSLTPSPQTHKHTLRYDGFGFPCFMQFQGVAIGVADITRPLIRVLMLPQNISTQHTAPLTSPPPQHTQVCTK